MAEAPAWPEGTRRVAAWLAERGHAETPVLLDDAARTAQQAADALGVALGQIAKSIIFRRLPDDAAVLVITSGDRRVVRLAPEDDALGDLPQRDAQRVRGLLRGARSIVQ